MVSKAMKVFNKCEKDRLEFVRFIIINYVPPVGDTIDSYYANADYGYLNSWLVENFRSLTYYTPSHENRKL